MYSKVLPMFGFAILLTASCGQQLDGVGSLAKVYEDGDSGNLQAQEVRLVRASADFCPPISGCHKQEFFQALIDVENLDYDKKVQVMIHLLGGGIQTLPARYLGSLKNNRELWIVNVSPSQRGFLFHLSYEVSGKTYLDTNRGQYYKISEYEATRILGRVHVGLDDTYSLMGRGGIWSGLIDQTLSGWVLVRDWQLHSQVSLVYTTDGWQTTITQPIAKGGDGSVGEAIGADPSELSIKFKVPLLSHVISSNIKFAIKYEMGSEVVWDNNFGHDFGIDEQGGFRRTYEIK